MCNPNTSLTIYLRFHVTYKFDTACNTLGYRHDFYSHLVNVVLDQKLKKNFMVKEFCIKKIHGLYYDKVL